jgi:hypothetical protein
LGSDLEKVILSSLDFREELVMLGLELCLQPSKLYIVALFVLKNCLL